MANQANSAPSDGPRPVSIESESHQLAALLDVSETIAQQRDLNALFHAVSQRLHSVLQFDFLALILHDALSNSMYLHVLEMKDHTEADQPSPMSMEDTPSGWVWESQQPFVSLDTSKDARYPKFMERLQEKGVHTIAILPLTTAQHRLGAMSFGRYVPQAMTEAELDFMKRVAAQVAVAVDNAINFEKCCWRSTIC